MDILALITIFSPLVGAGSVGFFGRLLGNRLSQLITTSFVIISALTSLILFKKVGIDGHQIFVPLFSWIAIGKLQVSFALHVDTLTVVMMFVVTMVSSSVHVYSIGYMARDDGIPRFMSFLSLFTFFMLILVSSSNLVQLFLGWEGVGLVSYLLIGFWYTKPAAAAAAQKAFLMNRIADLGFILGLAALYFVFKTFDFQTIFRMSPFLTDHVFSFFGVNIPSLTIICLLFFVAAMGKSAQIGFHTWLADAMEGPTPVSALIHAATMVTAGVFLIVRLSPLYEMAPFALSFMVIIGAVTAFFAGTIALTQNDIKRVIAYSTCSQLGYMFVAAGLSAYGASIFHLFTHAFFKALLFLGAGSLIHAMSNEQDLRKMGGVARLIPMTYIIMWIGSLALAGIPFFAGFYSKEAILEIAWGVTDWTGRISFWLCLSSAFLTAFYAWRLLFLAFHGAPRADERVMAHIHESPPVMMIPLLFLSIGAIFSGYLGYGLFIENIHDFWKNSLVMSIQEMIFISLHNLEWMERYMIQILPQLVTISGITLAFVFYVSKTELPKRFSLQFRELYAFFYNKWYFDELYEFLFIQPAYEIGHILWQKGDRQIIDGLGPKGITHIVDKVSYKISRIQTGFLPRYAVVMILGMIFAVTWGFGLFSKDFFWASTEEMSEINTSVNLDSRGLK